MENEQIKKILIDNNYVKESDVKTAEEYAKSHKSNFLDYLFNEGLLSKSILGQAIAEDFKVQFIDIANEKIDEEIFNLVPQLVAERHNIIAFRLDEKGVGLAMSNPDDLGIINLVEKRVGHPVIPYFALENDLKASFSMYSSGLQTEVQDILEKLKNPKLARELRDELVVKIVDLIMEYGYQNKSSDIHIEPYEEKVTVRFRIDGVMHDVLEIPKELLEYLLSRIKILSRMRTDEHRAAQDGKFRYRATEEDIDVRVSVLPVTQGENVVMRLLSSHGRQFGLTDLGLSSFNLEKLKTHIKNPHGMILVTGPTGSGKTTSLYSVLKILNRREVNIATIEDPVEYDMPGISQIQVNNKTDLSFVKGLRSIVRQDPDIIMVGEIRDEETASIAVNAALTGHLVLSTLHTNDAATTLPRLIDMNIEPFLVASTINVVVAQRLLRKICTNCRASVKLDKEQIAIFSKSDALKHGFEKQGYKDLSKLRLYKGAGCKVCGQTGYDGRIGVFEVLEMSEKIKDLILKSASSDEISALAQKEGMQTMLEDGIEKVLAGETTPEEVLRVVAS